MLPTGRDGSTFRSAPNARTYSRADGTPPWGGTWTRVREELGFEGFTPRPLTTYVWESDRESELVHSFTAVWTGEIRFDPHEIEEGRFWTITEIEAALGKGVFTPNFEQEFASIRGKL